MSSCLMIGAVALALSGDRFTLEWTHSVERVAWREEWSHRRAATEGVGQGSGAGMEPGPNAVRDGDWWVWRPNLLPQLELVLAASGATPSAWLLCDGDDCREIGQSRRGLHYALPEPEYARWRQKTRWRGRVLSVDAGVTNPVTHPNTNPLPRPSNARSRERAAAKASSE